MKILVAEDETVTRAFLQRVLKTLGHEVEAVGDGFAAWDVLSKPDAPRLVILDWVMPGLSGVQVCARIRATDTRGYFYVILLTAKKERQDIIAGLNCGADDYLVKPITFPELQARLQAGIRILNLEQRLQAQIEEMEGVLRRHNLLSEFVAQHTAPAPAVAVAAAAAAGAPVEAPASPEAPSETSAETGETSRLSPVSEPQEPEAPTAPPPIPMLACERLEECLLQVLENMRVGPVKALNNEDLPDLKTEFLAHTVFILEGRRRWVDLRIDTDSASADALFRAMGRSAARNESHLLDALAETANICQRALKRIFEEEDNEVLTPYLPRALPVRHWVRSRFDEQFFGPRAFALPGILLRCTMYQSDLHTLQKPIDELLPWDVLAEPVTSPANKALILLNKGTALNQRYIERIEELAAGRDDLKSVPVLEPSSVARALAAAV